MIMIAVLFLPPANEVCEAYVFTGICLSTGGGRFSLQGVSVQGLSVWGSLSRGSLSGRSPSRGGG